MSQIRLQIAKSLEKGVCYDLNLDIIGSLVNITDKSPRISPLSFSFIYKTPLQYTRHYEAHLIDAG